MLAERTILLVEDNDDNATIFRLVLEHYGYRVAWAADGEQGVRLARELRPDLILLDISLPLMSGWEVAATLRSATGTATIPIVVCSAHDSVADHARARTLGCEAYLTKPCTPASIATEVARCLASAEQARAAEPVRRRRFAAESAARAVVALLLVAAATGMHLRARRHRPWPAHLTRLAIWR